MDNNQTFQSKVDAADDRLDKDIFITLRELYAYGSAQYNRRNARRIRRQRLMQEIARETYQPSQRILNQFR